MKLFDELTKRLHLAKDYFRAVGRSENSGVPVLFRRHNLPPLVEIGLTDQPKIGTPRDDRPDIQYFYLSVCLSVGIGSKPSSL